jgi:peptidoglycan/LPS O-acetylase OafA/YrhL
MAHIAGGWPSPRAWSVGVTIVELCLYDFHKLPFTCSYLPGQSKTHVIFWGLLLVLAPSSAARVESQMLNRPFGYFCMIALLVLIATVARWRTIASAKSVEELVFEEEYSPELLALGLDRN